MSPEHHRRMAVCFLHRCCHRPVRSGGLHHVWSRNSATLGCPHNLLSWRLRKKTRTGLIPPQNICIIKWTKAYFKMNVNGRCSSSNNKCQWGEWQPYYIWVCDHGLCLQTYLRSVQWRLKDCSFGVINVSGSKAKANSDCKALQPFTQLQAGTVGPKWKVQLDK